jgi:hypothetical protein
MQPRWNATPPDHQQTAGSPGVVSESDWKNAETEKGQKERNLVIAGWTAG